MTILADRSASASPHRANAFEQTARHYRELLAQDPGNANVPAYYFKLAEAQYALGEYEHAADGCRAALRLQSAFAEAANMLGLALQALGRFEEAAEQYQAALHGRPEWAVALHNLGTALHVLGQRDAALQAYRAAVAAAPDFALARANLGQLLFELGQTAEALVQCQEAVRLQPSLPAAQFNLGNVLRTLRRWPEAQAAYEAALRSAPQLARAHGYLGRTLYLSGKREEAFRSLSRAVELAPQDEEVWQLLKQTYVAEANFSAAIPCSEQLLALNPREAARHLDLGWLLQMDGRLDEAAACYRRSLELQPQQVDVLVNQAALHADLGALDQAEAFCRQALAVKPRAAMPLAQLADLLRGKLPDADRQEVLACLGDPAVQGWPRANLLFALAHVQDARGEYAEAAAWLVEANALARKLRQEQGRHYDPAEHALSVDRGIAHYTPALFDRLAAAGSSSRQPVFVFGLPRSGTSLVEQVLAGHSRVHGAGELRLTQLTFAALGAQAGAGADWQTALSRLGATEVEQLAQAHLERLQALVRRAHRGDMPERIVDKMPENYLLLGFLALLFPRATFIHVRRDLRDVAVSCWMTNFSVLRWTNDPEHIAGRFRDYQRLMDHWQAVLPVRIHEVVYERLVDDFEREAWRLISACGLDWEPDCVKFHKTSRPVQTASVSQVRQPLYRKAVARWKHYEQPLASLFARLPSP